MTNLNTTSRVKIKKMRVGRGIGSGKGYGIKITKQEIIKWKKKY